MHALVDESKSNRSSFSVINARRDQPLPSQKIIDLIRRRMDSNEKFYSIETSVSHDLLLNFDEFTVLPLFTSITWFAENVEMDSDDNDFVEPAVQLINAITTTPTLLHLTCYKLTERKIERLLRKTLYNVLALRGDIVTQNQLFEHTIELVKLLKRKSAHISVAVGGYPELHPESSSLESEMKYLYEKVETGADFIITQTCFSSEKILQFIAECRNYGIKIPIIPGIFIPYSYKSLLSMCRLCKVSVPEEDFQIYKQLRDDVNAFEDFAVGRTIELLTDLFSNENHRVVGIHFFTLNNFRLMKRVTSNFDFK
ncbi:Methylenetetrahydrofolate reductase [Pseudolycoriella hygida]|uniref:Methylenetetrahydrofolate reductase n=1 Tax=Pseudolycoriella hygida TaxID=35572 RepID=A0A9Q0RX17_9DIPT|nr:Methylenetetrahydrofolate reductase [Pseudolycoriella hygida]